MKKPIAVSNLTSNLWWEYVKPAALAAGIMEEVPAHNKYIKNYTIFHTKKPQQIKLHTTYITHT